MTAARGAQKKRTRRTRPPAGTPTTSQYTYLRYPRVVYQTLKFARQLAASHIVDGPATEFLCLDPGGRRYVTDIVSEFYDGLANVSAHGVSFASKESCRMSQVIPTVGPLQPP